MNHTYTQTHTRTHCIRTLFHLIFISLFHDCIGHHLGHLRRLPGLCSIPLYIHTYVHTYVYQTTGNTIQYMSILVQCKTQLHPCTPTHNCSSTTCTCSVANPLLLCQRAYLLQPADGLLTVSCSCTRLSKRHTRKKQQSTCSW